MGSDLFLVRPTKSGHGSSVLTKEYKPTPGVDFTISNGVYTTQPETFSGETFFIGEKYFH